MVVNVFLNEHLIELAKLKMIVILSRNSSARTSLLVQKQIHSVGVQIFGNEIFFINGFVLFS